MSSTGATAANAEQQRSGQEVVVVEHGSEQEDRSTAAELAALLQGPLAHNHDTEGFIDSVNHHLRTPLTVILGHVEMWAEQRDDFPPELRESLDAVSRAGWRIADVGAAICDLIDVASVGPRTTGPVHVGDMVAGAVAASRGRATGRDIEVLATGDPTSWCVGDPARLQRAVRELLDNAVAHAPDGSTVRVAAFSGPSTVHVTVSDEGPGIDPAHRQRLVRPFERQADPARTGAGLGMGLAVAAAVAASHGGMLVLSEGAGGGLEARLDLPLDCRSFLQRLTS